jgi:hypothetical protein
MGGVRSIMTEKSALAAEGGGCTHTPFHSSYHHVQSCSVRSSWEGRYTPTISSYPYMYSVVDGRRWGGGGGYDDMQYRLLT